MEEEEIIALNGIWARRFLDPRFFEEQILPVMLENVEEDEYNRLYRDRPVDVFVSAVDFPYYAVFNAAIIKPVIFVGLIREGADARVRQEIRSIIERNIKSKIFFATWREVVKPREKIFSMPSEVIDALAGKNPAENGTREVVVVRDLSLISHLQGEGLGVGVDIFFRALEERIGSRIGSSKELGWYFYQQKCYATSLLPAPEIPTTRFEGDTKKWYKDTAFLTPPKSLGKEVFYLSP